MLGESSLRNKENVWGSKEGASLVNSTITALRDEVALLKQEKAMADKKALAEVDLLTLELGEYKKRLSSLTDKYLIETFTKEKTSNAR